MAGESLCKDCRKPITLRDRARAIRNNAADQCGGCAAQDSRLKWEGQQTLVAQAEARRLEE